MAGFLVNFRANAAGLCLGILHLAAAVRDVLARDSLLEAA